ncbi:NAD-dependent succinate-semialdehyde dehydrogenase [Candidatus Micrarchaeota archaeon]|nr:NAD-dependent succinate-semialdehyde dehydrogenase [Candidatus Micrarchaeota archaeon]
MKIQSVNPYTNAVNAEIDAQTSAQALDTCTSSHRAFAEWRKTDIHQRGEHLTRLAAVLRKNKDEYARLIAIEMGKPITQARSEVEKCAWTAEVYAQSAPTWLEDESVEADGLKHYVRYEPLGPVLGVMPWNFPFWQAIRYAVPALAAGNTTVLRHSNTVPLCAQAIGRAFDEAGFPKGAFGVILTDHDAVAELIASPAIAAVSFTGSESAGKHVAKLAAGALKKCVLELGGSDAFIVLDDADVDKAAKNAAQARTINSGQSCMCAKRFIVSEKIMPDFAEKFTNVMQSLIVGDPLDDQTQIGPLCNAKQRDEVESQTQDANAKGARVLCGGKRKEPGFFYEPTVLSGATGAMRVWTEEVFGPVAPLFAAHYLEQAVQVANNSEYGLDASVWTDSIATGEAVARQLECGVVFINGTVKSDPRMPCGGIKKSGIGRELGKWGLREFCNVKSINAYNP